MHPSHMVAALKARPQCQPGGNSGLSRHQKADKQTHRRYFQPIRHSLHQISTCTVRSQPPRPHTGDHVAPASWQVQRPRQPAAPAGGSCMVFCQLYPHRTGSWIQRQPRRARRELTSRGRGGGTEQSEDRRDSAADVLMLDGQCIHGLFTP